MRLAVTEVEALMAGRPDGTTLESALDVFEVFASGSLTDGEADRHRAAGAEGALPAPVGRAMGSRAGSCSSTRARTGRAALP
jgi:hypothetical protein